MVENNLAQQTIDLHHGGLTGDLDAHLTICIGNGVTTSTRLKLVELRPRATSFV